jgi:Protein of unknown function (DUF3485)
MKMSNTQKILWAGLAIAILLGLIWQLYPLPDAKKRMDTLPLVGKGFVGTDVPETEFEQIFFKGVNVIKRVYRIEHANFFVTVLDGTHNRHVVHDPYYCFTGSGWTIQSKKEIPLKHGDGEELVISKNNREKAAIFWFTDGTIVYRSPFEYWWKSTIRRLTLGRSGQESILIMIQPLDTTKDIDWKKITDILSPLVAL